MDTETLWANLTVIRDTFAGYATRHDPAYELLIVAVSTEKDVLYEPGVFGDWTKEPTYYSPISLAQPGFRPTDDDDVVQEILASVPFSHAASRPLVIDNEISDKEIAGVAFPGTSGAVVRKGDAEASTLYRRLAEDAHYCLERYFESPGISLNLPQLVPPRALFRPADSSDRASRWSLFLHAMGWQRSIESPLYAKRYVWSKDHTEHERPLKVEYDDKLEDERHGAFADFLRGIEFPIRYFDCLICIDRIQVFLY